MTVYVLSQYHGNFDGGDREIVGVYSAPHNAKSMADQRSGMTHNWSEHNSHGRSWTSDAGEYAVEEFEVTFS